jgi:hypothetical protein
MMATTAFLIKTTQYQRPRLSYARRLVSTNNGGSSSAILQNVAMFAIAGCLGYGAMAVFNSSDDSIDNNGSGPVSPSAPITSRVYFDVTAQNQPLGRVIIGLYGDTVPKTVANFQSLCIGNKNLNGKQLSCKFRN